MLTASLLMRSILLPWIASLALSVMPAPSTFTSQTRPASSHFGYSLSSTPTPPPPIVYTIAGSDSGGGAGIQADLLTIHAMQCHGCSAITCLTAQNSCGVSCVHAPPVSFLKAQLESLLQDLPPRAIKIGMLGTRDLAEMVGVFLKNMTESYMSSSTSGGALEKPWVVLDPVMISTSGHKLIDDDAEQAMKEHVFPYADVITPNKYEAEALLGRNLSTFQDVEQGARDLLDMGVRSVLIKGGHTLLDDGEEPKIARPCSLETHTSGCDDINATIGFAQDYFLSSTLSSETRREERLCDGDRGVWLRSARYDSEHTHGTGCTLSSAIASALALGHQRRQLLADADHGNYLEEGATSAIDLVDACCLAKAYVTAGIGRGVGLGQGPGPVVHTHFPSSFLHFPTMALHPEEPPLPAFRPMRPSSSSEGGSTSSEDTPVMGKILPIVDSVKWVEQLAKTPGITDIQLRFKKENDPAQILGRVRQCQAACRHEGVRLWINDHWQAAVDARCFGVHVGQEDLMKCIDSGGLEEMRKANIALGISTHSYGELSAALTVKPSYISLGPVFGTASKKVAFDAQGLAIVSRWRRLIHPDVPFVTIGGIDTAEAARRNKEAGADCVAVIGAIRNARDVADAVQMLNESMH